MVETFIRLVPSHTIFTLLANIILPLQRNFSIVLCVKLFPLLAAYPTGTFTFVFVVFCSWKLCSFSLLLL